MSIKDSEEHIAQSEHSIWQYYHPTTAIPGEQVE